MKPKFRTAELRTDETTIFVRLGGAGPPLLLLHGFPETHLMWREVAPILAGDFTVVCADLRGYGPSGCPDSAPDHSPYSKRAMARDMVAVMDQLGHRHFSVAGHDRGGRVAYRMALDHRDRIARLAVLDIVSTETAWRQADDRFAQAFWPWSLLAHPEPLPERILTAAADAIVDNALDGWGSPPEVFPRDIRAAYVEALRGPGMRMPSVRSTAPRPRSRARSRRPRSGAPHRLPVFRALERTGAARHLVCRRRGSACALASVERRCSGTCS